MGLYKADAVVLRNRNLGEADRILTLYAKETGKFDAVAKGVRKVQSKMRGSVQPLTYYSFVLYSGRSLDTVTQSETKEMFIGVRENLNTWAYGTYMMELLAAMVPEREPNEAVFALLLSSLHLLAAVDKPEVAARVLEVHLLKLLGYQPELNHCAACHQRVEGGNKLRFSAALGGVICEECFKFDPTAVWVKGGELAAWRQLLQMELHLLPRLKLSEEVNSRLAGLIQYYLQYHLDSKLKSTDFIRHLKDLRVFL